MATNLSPSLAVVIPIHRQPGLAVEAIACALREAEAVDGVVILVNDGCPFVETHELCLDFAQGHPERIVYLRTANAGLSAARNRGIRHALARFPGVGGIFLLDADNRLKPGAMRRAMDMLGHAGADWVYPDFDKFDTVWHGDMSGPYSVLRHLMQNICDAGCLIHRRVFAAGLAFDETLRGGYEDWDFWLRCAAAGFRGVHCPDIGFQYRARRESMVRDADRMRAELVAAMRTRLNGLFAAGPVLRAEHQEAPRFCLIHDTQGVFDFTSLPGASTRRGDIAELETLFWQAVCHPVRSYFPPFVVAMHRGVLLDLQRQLLAEWLFWLIETLLEHHTMVTIRLIPGPGPIFAQSRASDLPDGDDPPAHMVATRFACLRDDLSGHAPMAATVGIVVTLTAPCAVPEATSGLAATRARLAASRWRHAVDERPEWRASPLIPARTAGSR